MKKKILTSFIAIVLLSGLTMAQDQCSTDQGSVTISGQTISHQGTFDSLGSATVLADGNVETFSFDADGAVFTTWNLGVYGSYDPRQHDKFDVYWSGTLPGSKEVNPHTLRFGTVRGGTVSYGPDFTTSESMIPHERDDIVISGDFMGGPELDYFMCSTIGDETIITLLIDVCAEESVPAPAGCDLDGCTTNIGGVAISIPDNGLFASIDIINGSAEFLTERKVSITGYDAVYGEIVLIWNLSERFGYSPGVVPEGLSSYWDGDGEKITSPEGLCFFAIESGELRMLNQVFDLAGHRRDNIGFIGDRTGDAEADLFLCGFTDIDGEELQVISETVDYCAVPEPTGSCLESGCTSTQGTFTLPIENGPLFIDGVVVNSSILDEYTITLQAEDIGDYENGTVNVTYYITDSLGHSSQYEKFRPYWDGTLNAVPTDPSTLCFARVDSGRVEINGESFLINTHNDDSNVVIVGDRDGDGYTDIFACGPIPTLGSVTAIMDVSGYCKPIVSCDSTYVVQGSVPGDIDVVSLPDVSSLTFINECGVVDTVVSEIRFVSRNGCISIYTEEWMNGAEVLLSRSITVTDVIAITSSVNISCDDAFISVVGNTDYAYLWNDGSTDLTLDVDTSGNYQVTVTNASGCSDIFTIEVIIPDLPEVTIDEIKKVSACNFQSGFAHVSGIGGTAPYTYLWSTGATTDFISNVTSGLYMVTVTDLNGCEASTQVNIDNVQPLQVTGISELTHVDPLSTTNNLGSFTVNATGGVEPYQYSIDGGATYQNSPVFTGLEAAKYNVTVKDADQCTTGFSNIVIGKIGCILMPNPVVKNGLVTAKILLVDQSITIRVQLLNGNGQVVNDFGTVELVDGQVTNVEFSAPSEAGMYYLRLLDIDGGEIVNLTKKLQVTN